MCGPPKCGGVVAVALGVSALLALPCLASTETIVIEGELDQVQPGSTVAALVKLEFNTTPLFGYSIDVDVLADPDAKGSVTANVELTNFFAGQNVIAAGGAEMDGLMSVIVDPGDGGVFVSANTDDSSTVLAVPDINDVLAEVVFDISEDASGEFCIRLGRASALSDGEGTAVPFVFFDALIVVLGDTCPADINGDEVVDVLDLLAVLAAWGQTDVPEDVNEDGVVDVLDLLEVLAAWGAC